MQQVVHCAEKFQSTPPARGATNRLDGVANGAAISIHAPREGGDRLPCPQSGSSFDFNPRPPRGGRPLPHIRFIQPSIFQSTPPARGATLSGDMCLHLPGNFNPRPPRGGRRLSALRLDLGIVISIHAPREGGDFAVTLLPQEVANFNPRPPRGGRHS